MTCIYISIDWTIVTGRVYTVMLTFKNGETHVARAEQDYIRDGNWTGWVTHYSWHETYQGLTSGANSYAWFNEDPSINLPAKSVNRWQDLVPPTQVRAQQIRSLARNTAMGFFGVVAVGAAIPAAVFVSPSIAQGGQFVWNGLRSELSLVRHISTRHISKGINFGLNMGLQIVFNGKDADVYDAAATAYNPYVGFVTNWVFNYKPASGHNPFQLDRNEEALSNFLISVPFFMFGTTVNTVSKDVGQKGINTVGGLAIDASEATMQQALKPIVAPEDPDRNKKGF